MHTYLSLQTIQWVDQDIDQVRAEMEGLKSGNRKKYIRPEVGYLRPQLKKHKNILTGYFCELFSNSMISLCYWIYIHQGM